MIEIRTVLLRGQENFQGLHAASIRVSFGHVYVNIKDFELFPWKISTPDTATAAA